MKSKKPATVKRLAVHYTAEYIINPAHPVTVNVIGCGGTGSQVINSLGRMNAALRTLGHPGLFVRAIDPKKVTAANMGRQLFSQTDIDAFKCVTLVGRVNRFFGTDWEGIPELYNSTAKVKMANIAISCVDSGRARSAIKAALFNKNEPSRFGYGHPYEHPYYWLDFGNTMDKGQVVLGTIDKVKQPGKSDYTCRETLPTIDELHPDILVDGKDEDQGPSCSLAEALQKQDLFINTNLANMGLDLLWKMFRELHLRHHGCYMNLASMSVNPIPIK